MFGVLKRLVVSLFLLCVLCLPAFAGSVDLSQYEVGSIPEDLGMVQVAKSKKLGKNILEPVAGQESYISLPCSMSSPLTISFKKYSNPRTDLVLIGADGKKYIWEIGNYLRVGGVQLASKPAGTLNRYSTIKLVIKGRSARFFSDDKFIGSQVVPTDLKLQEIKILFTKGYAAITDIDLQEDSAPAEPAQ